MPPTLFAVPLDVVRPDGLYRYTAAERDAAGHRLQAKIIDQVSERGFLAKLLGVPRLVASQIVNCFALDKCYDALAVDTAGLRISEWEVFPRDGYAVSPDDLLMYDAPSPKGGVYGYNEVLAYRQSRLNLIHRWTPIVSGNGTVVGRVLLRNSPVAGATVEIGGKTTVTDASGLFSLSDVEAGSRAANASYYNPAEQRTYAGTAPLDVLAGATVGPIDIIIDPNPRYRRVVVRGDIAVQNSEPGDDPPVESFSAYYEVALNPMVLSSGPVVFFDVCVGNEISLVLQVSTNMNIENYSVDAAITSVLYEWTSCKNKDRAAFETQSRNVLRNTVVDDVHFHLVNTENHGGDWADITLSAENWDE